MSTDTQINLLEARLSRRDLLRSAMLGAGARSTPGFLEACVMAINSKYVSTGFNALFYNEMWAANIRSAT